MRLPRLIAVLLLLGSLAARADDLKDQAKRDVSAGLTAQSAGRYDEAIALYKKAYAAIPHPELLFNLGQAYRLKGDVETALEYYRRYLAAEPSGRVAGDANRWVSELGKRLADRKREQDRREQDRREQDRREQDRKARDAARKADPVPRETTRKADANARETTRTSNATGSADTSRTAGGVGAADTGRKADAASADARTGPAGPPAPVGGVAPVVTAEASNRVAGQTVRPQDARPARDNTATWIAAIGGGVALIGGLGIGSLASSKLDQATAICGPDHRCDSPGDTERANALLAESRTRGDISTALVVVGVAALATSAALWWHNRDADGSGVAIAPIVSAHGVGIALGGRL